MKDFTYKEQTCPVCEQQFHLTLWDNGAQSEYRCARCEIKADSLCLAQSDMMAAFYSIPPWKLAKMHACIALGHELLPDKECLECCLNGLKTRDGRWVGVYYKSIEEIADEYSLTRGMVREKLDALSEGQCRVLTGR